MWAVWWCVCTLAVTSVAAQVGNPAPVIPCSFGSDCGDTRDKKVDDFNLPPSVDENKTIAGTIQDRCDLTTADISHCAWDIAQTHRFTQNIRMRGVNITCAVEWGSHCVELSDNVKIWIEQAVITGTGDNSGFIQMLGDNSSVYMNNVQVTHMGNSGSRGGVIYSDGYRNNYVEMTNVDMSHNTGYHGAVVYMRKGRLVITNSAFTYNLATYSGGVIRSNYADITITNTTMSNNTAQWGGAISLWDSNMNLTSTTMTYNQATWDGGAIAIYGNGKQVTLHNTVFKGNTADRDESAVYCSKFSGATTLALNIGPTTQGLTTHNVYNVNNYGDRCTITGL